MSNRTQEINLIIQENFCGVKSGNFVCVLYLTAVLSSQTGGESDHEEKLATMPNKTKILQVTFRVWPLWPWPYLQFHLAIDLVTFGHRSGHSCPKSPKSVHYAWSCGHT